MYPPDWAPWKLLCVPKHLGTTVCRAGVACSVTPVGKCQGCQHQATQTELQTKNLILSPSGAQKSEIRGQRAALGGSHLTSASLRWLWCPPRGRVALSLHASVLPWCLSFSPKDPGHIRQEPSNSSRTVSYLPIPATTLFQIRSQVTRM